MLKEKLNCACSNILPIFIVCLCIFFILNFESPLYILDISPLPARMCFINIVSQCVACLVFSFNYVF